MQRNFEQVKINEIEINTLVEGDGKPVIFVHGWPESWYSWRNQIEPFKKAGYKVIIPDIRGYGRSSNPKEVEKYTLKEITKDLIGILDFLSSELNIHDYIITNPSSTFCVKVSGDSMIGAGINSGDILVIDRSIKPSQNLSLIHISEPTRPY